MPLPPVETTPVLLMRFTPKASREVILTTLNALSEGGILVVDSEGVYDENGSVVGYANGSSAVVLGLTTTQRLLEHEAEILRLSKPCRTPHQHIAQIMDHFVAGARKDFINFARENESDYDVDGLFTSAERALLLDSMINAIECPQSLLGVEGGRPSGSKVGEAYHKLTRSTVGSAYQKLWESAHRLDEYETANTTLCQTLLQKEYVDVISPVHIPHIKKRVQKDMYKMFTPPPLQALRDYYGEEVAFYFAWMHFMTKWFVFPGLLGLTVYIIRLSRGETVDECELTPLVGLATFGWAFFCNRMWDRREAELAFKWGTFALTDGDRLSLGKRAGFRGKMRRSPISGNMERFYPARRRQLKIVISAIITLFLLGGACVVMVISMNLQGYVSFADKELWGDEEHPLYFPLFSNLAEEGGIFDANSAWKCFIPIILRAAVVATMNQQYSTLAEKLTEWENHETVAGHQNSLVLKRVLFECFDAFVVLFYLAIYERDINLLRLELVGAFNVDTLRRVFTECVLPFAIRYFNTDPELSKSKKEDDLHHKVNNGPLTSEADLLEYDTFDDYIEMLIQWGYVVLFASAYPLAAFLAVGANLVEMRSDMWKLGNLFRRRTPVRACGIGMWKNALKTIAWLAASSNLLIFAFTSSQLRQWLPDYYEQNEVTGRSMPKASSAHEILLIVLVLEHCLIIAASAVNTAIRRVPGHVRLEINRAIWVHEKMASSGRQRTVKRASVEINALTRALGLMKERKTD